MTTHEESCPPENDIAELALGGLKGARRAIVEAHLDTCSTCRAVVAELAASNVMSVSPAARSVVSATHGEALARAVLQRGDSFGRYVVLAWLGAGAMGAVYRARDTLLQREVALKILAPGTPGATRALREARAGAAIDHPNVAPVFDCGVVEGTTFIAMELVTGRTLRERMADPDVTIAARIEWLVSIASALGSAHERGVVHRDVKPENVMVREDGIVKVLDFGLASHHEAESEARLTAKGSVLGTPGYMAPEQLRGEEAVAASDQFAWGITAFETLCGARPWSIASDEAMASGCPPLPAAVGADVHEVIARALDPRPSRRYASMAEALDALVACRLPPDVKVGEARVSFGISRAIFAAAILVMIVAAVRGGSGANAVGRRALVHAGAPRSRLLSANVDAADAYQRGVLTVRTRAID